MNQKKQLKTEWNLTVDEEPGLRKPLEFILTE
jgi:hypothetical protein